MLEVTACADESDELASLEVYNAVWPREATTMEAVHSYRDSAQDYIDYLVREDGVVLGSGTGAIFAYRPGRVEAVADRAGGRGQLHDRRQESLAGARIAGALKAAEINWALDNGYTELHTSNEERNAPIQRLNAHLGYRPRVERIHLVGPSLADVSWEPDQRNRP